MSVPVVMTTALLQQFVTSRLNLAWVDTSPHLLFATNVRDEPLRTLLRTSQTDHINATAEIRETISSLITRWKTEFDKLETVVASFQDVLSHNANLCIERARVTGTWLNQNPTQQYYLPEIAKLQCQINYLSPQDARGPLSKPIVMPQHVGRGKHPNGGRKKLLPHPNPDPPRPPPPATPRAVTVIEDTPEPEASQPSGSASQVNEKATQPSGNPSGTQVPRRPPPEDRCNAWNSINANRPAVPEPSGSKRKRGNTPEAEDDDGEPDPAWVAAVAKQKAKRAAEAEARLQRDARAQALTAAVDAPEAASHSIASAQTKQRTGGIAAWGKAVLRSGTALCM
jgi:hypothetical protein